MSPWTRPLDELPSKREQQVLEILHRMGRATVAEVHEALPDPASYNAVRGSLRVLEEKGWVEHAREGRRYVYQATTSRAQAGRRELLRLLRAFFGGSTEALVSTLLESEPPDPEELDRLQRLVEEAREGEEAP